MDANTAAQFSGGNARIAIALADTVTRGGTLASLTDSQLFERLFLQRQGQDRSLLETAQACALVYSFNAEDMSEEDESELARLAHLAGITVDRAYRDVAELLRRDLAQRRGRWRAILPHAVANRLAETALQNIPFSRVQECLINGAPERLTKSFSRRLGYLNTSREAIDIVREWFDPESWVGSHVWNLNEFRKTIFQNSLPVCPEAGLRALEANLPTYDRDAPITTGDYVPRALRALAWDAALFDRCVALLEVLAIYGEGSVAKEAKEVHTSLFQFILSGTHATIKQRTAVLTKLLNGSNSLEQDLGLATLDAMLKSMHFSSQYHFEFGSHSRDYGYHPRTRREVLDWYRAVLAVAEEVGLSGSPISDAVKTTVAGNFRGLWTVVGLQDELEKISTLFAAQEFWRDGWLAVRQTRLFDAKDKNSANYARLSRLEDTLKPRSLVQRIRGRVLASRRGYYESDDVDLGNADTFRVAREKGNEEAIALGIEAANDSAALRELLPEIVRGGGNLWYFGIGLARGTKNPKKLWEEMLQMFAEVASYERNVGAFCGFLAELDANKLDLTNQLLDEALENELLAAHFPSLQASVVITPDGMARLVESVQLGKAPMNEYANIHLGRAVEVISSAAIANYILTLAKAPNGEDVAVTELSMLFFNDRQCKRPHAPEIISVGRQLLSQMEFKREKAMEDHHLHEIIRVCAAGDGGDDVAIAVCSNLKRAVAEHRISGVHCGLMLRGLFEAQPRATLDALLTGDAKAIASGKYVIEQGSQFQQNPLDAVNETMLLDWCDKDPEVRFAIAASVVSAFSVSEEDNPIAWAPIASRLVHSSPDPIAVMRELVARFRPMVWSGSRSTILSANASFLDQFDTLGNGKLATFIATQKENLQEEARAQLEWETKMDKNLDERFE